MNENENENEATVTPTEQNALGKAKVLGILQIIDCVFIGLYYFVAFAVFIATNHGTGVGVLVFEGIWYVWQVLLLVLNIWVLTLNRRANREVTGQVLGIIASGLLLVSGLFAFPSFVLSIIASVFTLLRRPSRRHPTYHDVV